MGFNHERFTHILASKLQSLVGVEIRAQVVVLTRPIFNRTRTFA